MYRPLETEVSVPMNFSQMSLKINNMVYCTIQGGKDIEGGISENFYIPKGGGGSEKIVGLGEGL